VILVQENYYALLICILRPGPVTIEMSFDLMGGKITKAQNKSIKSKDVEDMIQMKQQGMTHRAIGEMYGLSEEAVYRRIKRYKEAVKV